MKNRVFVILVLVLSAGTAKASFFPLNGDIFGATTCGNCSTISQFLQVASTAVLADDPSEGVHNILVDNPQSGSFMEISVTIARDDNGAIYYVSASYNPNVGDNGIQHRPARGHSNESNDE